MKKLCVLSLLLSLAVVVPVFAAPDVSLKDGEISVGNIAVGKRGKKVAPAEHVYPHKGHGVPLSSEQRAVIAALMREKGAELDKVDDAIYVQKQVMAAHMQAGNPTETEASAKRIVELRQARRAILRDVYKAAAEKLHLPCLEDECRPRFMER